MVCCVLGLRRDTMAVDIDGVQQQRAGKGCWRGRPVRHTLRAHGRSIFARQHECRSLSYAGFPRRFGRKLSSQSSRARAVSLCSKELSISLQFVDPTAQSPHRPDWRALRCLVLLMARAPVSPTRVRSLNPDGPNSTLLRNLPRTLPKREPRRGHAKCFGQRFEHVHAGLPSILNLGKGART